MITSLEFKTSDNKFIELVKQMAKFANIDVVEHKKPSRLDKAIKEVENGEVETFKNFNDFEKSLNA